MRYWLLIIAIVLAMFVGIAIADAAKPVQRLLIVEEAQQKAANDAAVKLFGRKAADTFSVKMQDDAKKPYFVCSWRLSDADAAKLKAELDKISGKKPITLSKAVDPKNPKANEFVSARGKLKELKIDKPKEVK